MARRARPILASLPFEYVVLGKPRSHQIKGRAYHRWYQKIINAVTNAVDHASNSRGFIPLTEKVGVVIIWFSAQPDAPDHPDVDAIIKPLIDGASCAPSGNASISKTQCVIVDDSQVRYIRAARLHLNTPNLQLPAVVQELEDEDDYTLGEVVFVSLIAISDARISMQDFLP